VRKEISPGEPQKGNLVGKKQFSFPASGLEGGIKKGGIPTTRRKPSARGGVRGHLWLKGRGNKETAVVGVKSRASQGEGVGKKRGHLGVKSITVSKKRDSKLGKKGGFIGKENNTFG